MHIINFCPSCESSNIAKKHVRMSQFLIDRMTSTYLKYPPICNLIECLDCNFFGSDTRFSEQEELNHYKNYAEEEYLNHRVSYEGEWIKSTFAYYATRYESKKRQTEDFLNKNLNINNINSLIDYGGGAGKAIPDCFIHTKKYILDISNQPLEDKFIRLSPTQSIDPVDLIFSSHTLEHVSYPKIFINEMKKYAKSGTYFYIEVPEEKPNDLASFSEEIHEHINLFAFKSLDNLLISNGINIVDRRITTYGHALCCSVLGIIP